MIPKPFLVFFQLSVLSSHHQTTVFRVTVRSLWKTEQGKRTQYCFNSSGFGDSFIRSFTPERKGGHLGGQTGQNRTEGHVSVSYWSLADDRFQPCLQCADVAALPPVIGGPSDLRGFDSSERMSSYGVGRAGRRAFSGQV